MLKIHLTPLLFLLSIFSIILFGQVSQYVVDVKVSTATEGNPISLSLQLTQNTQVTQINFFYRQFGETEFNKLDMIVSGRVAVVTIPSKKVAPPYIEYYVSIQLADGSETTFPSENPIENPLKIQVQARDPKESEILILSPEPGEILPAEDLGIAISLMYASDNVDKARTRLYFDNIDVTKEAILSDDVILYSPKNFNRPIDLGEHNVKIELYDKNGNLYFVKTTDFNLSTAIAIEEVKSTFKYLGNAQLEFRQEKFDTVSTTYIRGDVNLNATYKFLTGGFNMHLTNEDKPDRQPQNRYLATLQASEYVRLQIGDAYPAFPSLFISGKRVRGITGSITTGYVNLDISYGKTMRAVEGIEKGIRRFSESDANADPNDKKVVQRITPDTADYMLFDRGTFSQKFLAVRPSFGSGENFQLGFIYLKAQDDTNSIRYGRYPRENFVAGTDLLLAFDNQRVKWFTQVAFSLLNTNIEGGNFTDEDFDQYKLASATTHDDSVQALKEAQDLKDLAKLGRKFITVNPNMSPIDPIDGLPSLSIETEFTLNYFNNFVRAVLFRRGQSYTSFGNEFLQKDIAGFNLSDRIRLFDNRVLASVSYESKWNNLQKDPNKPVTTFNTLNTSVTLYPGVKLPIIMIGYGFNTRKNPIDLSDSVALGRPLLLDNITLRQRYGALNYYTFLPPNEAISIADEITNRYYIASSYDFNFHGRQSANVSISISQKTDNTFYLRDQENYNFGGSLTTYYNIPLQTTVAFVISNNATYNAVRDTAGAYLATKEKRTFNYQTFSVNARYRMLGDRLNLLATFAPSFGDFKRLLLQMGADYQIRENHYVVGQFDLINNPKSTDLIFSIIYRFSF